MVRKAYTSTFTLLLVIWRQLSSKRKMQLAVVMALMIITSLAEILSIGSVGPLLSVLISPKGDEVNEAAIFIGKHLPGRSSEEVKLSITTLFVMAALLAAALRLTLLWASTNIAFKIGADFGGLIFRKTLYQPFVTHLMRNSSEIVSAISDKTKVSTEIITESLTLISTVLMIVLVIVALCSVHPEAALIAGIAFGGIYYFISIAIKNKIITNSITIARGGVASIRLLQEALGGVRDIIINNNQEIYVRLYRKLDKKVKHAQGENWFLARSPRYTMEGLGMGLIGVTAYVLTANQNRIEIMSVVPLLGVIAFAAQRVLPMLQQAYYAITFIRSNKSSLQDTVELLAQVDPPKALGDEDGITFDRCIQLRNVSFSYSGSSEVVINNVTLEIKKGMKIGVIGKSGSGKSTLIDLVMGLLSPTLGALCVDGVEIGPANQSVWGKSIGHVPQTIFLIDGTIEENIAFGVEGAQPDTARVIRAAKLADVHDFVSEMPEGYKTIVGERGVRLSGGQRQRIGIARALYKSVQLYVLDEATSALDLNTESAVMEGLNKAAKNSTFIIVAHRMSTLSNCDMILRVDKGLIATEICSKSHRYPLNK